MYQDTQYAQNHELHIEVNHPCNKFARYERANITLAYGFCSQALVGDNQKISIEKNVNLSHFTLEKVF